MKGTGQNLFKKILFFYFYVDWEDLQKIYELNTDNLTKIYVDKSNMLLLDTYVPLKRINKYKLKFNLNLE